MLKMLSDYTHHMEELVRQREAELHSEKKQVEDMLYNILPRFTVDTCLSLRVYWHFNPFTANSLKI